jgi:hypothetical protein
MTEPHSGPSDVFISHASIDKDSVAKPLASALDQMGWTVWLDELELLVGDSLNKQIDAALTKARYGVVVLSPAFFSRPWPQKELAALAAKEIDSETTVILPVWHNVDHSYIVKRSSLLADRLGVNTATGIDNVATEISRVLRRSTEPASDEPAAEDRLEELLSIPATRAEQDALIAQRADWWEYRLFAGALMEGLLRLEDKWQDHQLRLPGGPRRYFDHDRPGEFFSEELSWMRRQLVIERIFAPGVMERAFGASGEPGDPERIRHLADRLIQMYGGFMDWAARLRNTGVPGQWEELAELYARMVDLPLQQIRDFIQLMADGTAQLAIMARDGTEEDPVIVRFELVLSVDETLMKEIESVTG